MAVPGIDIYDLYLRFLNLINSTQFGWFKPTQFARMVDEVSMEMWRDKVQEWENNQDIVDTLAVPFLNTINITLNQVSGLTYDIAAYPADYGHFSSCRIIINKDNISTGAPKCDTLDSTTGKCKKYIDPDEQAQIELERDQKLTEIKVYKIDNARWGRVNTHVWQKPSLDNPIITQYNQGFKVAPKGIGVIVLDYFTVPTKVVFAYTIGANDEIIYNQGASVQPQWPFTAVDELLYRLGKKAGIYVKDWTTYQAMSKESESNK